MVVMMSLLIVQFHLPDSLLFIFAVPSIIAAFTYPRWVTLSMVALLMIIAARATAILYSNPDTSHTTILIAGASTVLATEIVHALVTTRQKLQHSRELLLLEDSYIADAGVELMSCEDDKAVFDTIETFFTNLALDAIVIVNQATPDQKALITRSVVGLSATLFAQGERIAGFRVIGQESAIVAKYRDIFHQDRLHQLAGGFAELASSEINPAQAGALAGLFGLHDVYTIGIADASTIYGNVHIIMRAPDAALPDRTIEAFIYQCFMTLSRMKANRALALSEEKFRLLFRNMNAAFALHEIIRDPAGQPCDYRFLEMNTAFENATGLEAKTVLGRSVLEVLPQTESSWIETYGRVVDTGEPILLENYSQALDRFYEVVAYRPEAERFATVFHDVTERRRAQAALQTAHDELEARVAARTAELQAQYAQADAILNGVRDAVLLTDAEQRVVYTNPAFTELTGYTAEQTMGVVLDQGAPGATSFPIRVPAVVALNRQEPWQGDIACTRQDGRRYEAALTIVPVRDVHNPITGYVFSLQDITQRKALIRARDRFISNISHQFRTPITTLKLMTHLLSSSNLPDSAQTQVQAMSTQIEWLTQLLQDILAITALDSGKAIGDLDTLSVPRLLQTTIQKHQKALQEKSLTLIPQPLPTDLPSLRGDAIQLSRALDKLISNAIRYSPPRGTIGVSVTDSNRPEDINTGDWIAITIRDQGPGIPRDEQERIFERFYRGRIADAGDTHGTGLGLSIAQQIVAAHGGKITVETEPGKGSAFTMWLPAGSAG
jgi:PAS domain S-box-containing protein